MKQSEEILFDRMATAVKRRATAKKYVLTTRTAWGERILVSLNAGSNDPEFTGLILDPALPSLDGEPVTVGFYHPLFTGCAPRYTKVEVVKNLCEDLPVDYIAVGRGLQTVDGHFICLDEVEADPCDPDAEPGPCARWTVGWGGFEGSELGDEGSYSFYDRLTRTDPIGINELPARLELRGYSGVRELPDWVMKPVRFNWSPGVSAFDVSFQSCGAVVGRPGIQFDTADCCALKTILEEEFGADWQTIIKNDPALLQGIDPWCRWILDWNWQ